MNEHPYPTSIFKCVVCDGAGHVFRPPWIPGDQRTWDVTNTSSHQCKVCKGLGYLVVER